MMKPNAASKVATALISVFLLVAIVVGPVAMAGPASPGATGGAAEGIGSQWGVKFAGIGASGMQWAPALMSGAPDIPVAPATVPSGPSVSAVPVEQAAAADPESVEMTPDLEHFRSDLSAFYEGMSAVASRLKATQMASDTLRQRGLDPGSLVTPEGSLAAMTAQMTPYELAVMKAALDQLPQWRETPALLLAQLDEVEEGPDVLSGSSASEGGISIESLYGYAPPASADPWAMDGAKGTALTLEIVFQCMPADAMTILARIPAVAAWGIAQAAVLVLERVDAIRDEYDTTYLIDHVGDTHTQLLLLQTQLTASTASLDDHMTNQDIALADARLALDDHMTNQDIALADARLELDDHMTNQDIALADARLALDDHMTNQDIALADARAALDDHLIDQDTALADARAALDDHLIDQDDYMAETRSLIQTQLDAQDTFAAESRLISQRLRVEDALVVGQKIGQFQMPNAVGGYLEMARDIVVTTIDNAKAAGQPVYGAERELARGDAAYATGEFKVAYGYYCAAYQEAVR